MAVGKNKRLTKGKKGQKKKVVDVFTKKDWYDIKAPAYFKNRQVGKTLVTRTQGTKLAVDGLRGRVFEVNLADLNDSEASYRKMRLVCEEVDGKDLLLNFHGMDMTRDKLCGLIRKWQTMIEAFVDVKTTDGFVLRIFCIGFTNKQPNSDRKTCYAKASQIRGIRNKMVEIIQREASTSTLKELVEKFIPESISADILKACQSIYPLKDVFIRKVKVIKKPKFDFTKLLEVHGGAAARNAAKAGAAVGSSEFVEPTPQESV